MGIGRNLLAAAVIALAPGVMSCESCNSKEKAVEQVRVLLDDWYKKVSAVDIADGADNFNEKAILKRFLDYLDQLKKTEPEYYSRYALQVEAILKAKKPLENDSDIALDNEIMEPRTLMGILKLRERNVKVDGVVQFASKEDEAELSLADLTPETEILFEANNPNTLKKIGISAKGAFTIFRVEEETEGVLYNGKKITVERGTFVVKTQEGSLHRVCVFDGDKIIDVLSRDFTEGGSDEDVAPTPKVFEGFLAEKMPIFSLNTGRRVFRKQYPTYHQLITTDYKDLLVKKGIPLEKSFVYYLQWCEAMRVPPSETSMREYFEFLLKTRRGKDEPDNEVEPSGPSWSDKVADIAKKAVSFLETGDEDRLSYHDERVTDPSQQADILRKKYSTLFAIVRLQGRFFDNYTYNRLSGNYFSRVSAATHDGKEFLRISDLEESLGRKAPSDVRERAKSSNFIQRINATTNFSSSSDGKFKKALAYSEGVYGGNQVSTDDFKVSYASDGSITAISFKGKAYEPSKFISSPASLKQLPSETVPIKIGNVQFNVDINQYFDQYHALEARNQNASQNIIIYNKESNRTSVARNMMWFVERDVSFDRPIAQEITRGAGSPQAKILALANWLQVNLEYIDEISEINKITIGTLMDIGGDCEDSFIALKTLAESIGLGGMVGAVLFDGHIAPIVKGKLGPTKYNVNGSKWTIVELATQLGRSARPGVTNHNEPHIFMIDENTIFSADGNHIPLSIVPIGEIQSDLVKAFDNQIEYIEEFLDDNQIDESSSAEQMKSTKEKLLARLDKLVKSYGNIASTGKMADEINDKYKATLNKIATLERQIMKIGQDRESELKRKMLQDQPEEMQKSVELFFQLYRNIADNIGPLHKRISGILKRYNGKESNYQAMINCNSEMVAAMNESEVYMDFGRMKNIFRETLKYSNPETVEKVEEMLNILADAINEVYFDNVNIVRQNIRMHEGR